MLKTCVKIELACFAGSGQFGVRSIVEQAAQYMDSARQHPHNYKVPQVLFVLMSGITPPLHQALKNTGIDVQATIQEVDHDTEVKVQQVKAMLASSDEEENEGETEDIQNLAQNMAQQEVAGGNEEITQEDVTSVLMDDVKSEMERIVITDDNKDIISSNERKDDKSIHLRCDVLGNIKAESTLETTSSCQNAYDASFKSCDDKCDKISPNSDEKAVRSTQCFANQPVISKVNLDITTLISLVSNLCHGSCDLVFEEPILSQQAEQERDEPLLPKLNSFIKGDFLKGV